MLAHEYGWTLAEIFDLTLKEVNLLLESIGRRKQLQAGDSSTAGGPTSTPRNSIRVDSDTALANIEMMMPGSVEFGT